MLKRLLDTLKRLAALPAVRSALRSLLFNVAVPVVLLLAADEGARLVGFGLDKTQAAMVAEFAGIVLRAYLPNVFGARSQVVLPRG